VADAYLAATSDEALMSGMTGDDSYGLVQVAARRAGIGRTSPNALAQHGVLGASAA
jgi:hypothetical protein